MVSSDETVTIRISERQVLNLVLEFLENRRFHIAQIFLERETGVINGEYSDDLLFLRQLILDGQWDAAMEFVNPLKQLEAFPIRKFRFLITKYKYLELLCIKQESGPLQNNEFAVEEIVECLKELEGLCDNIEEFRKLCVLLTLPKLSEHELFRTWNPSNARMECFCAILPLVSDFINDLNPNKESSNVQQEHASGDRLVQLIVKGLLYESAVLFCQTQALEGKNIKQTHQYSNLLSRKEKLSSADLSLISWLEVLKNEQFTIPFQQKSLDFRMNSFAKPPLEAQWNEQILTTPMKPRGQFPHSLVPHSKPKFAQKIMVHSLTASLVLEPGKRNSGSSSLHHQPMSQSTLPSIGAFSIQQQQQPNDQRNLLGEDVMRQSQVISAMLSESDTNTASISSHSIKNNSLNDRIIRSTSQSNTSDSIPQNPHQELENICRRNQLKFPASLRDKIPEETNINALATVPELSTPIEMPPPVVHPSISADNPMVQSRLFQEFQQAHRQQPQVPDVPASYQQIQQQNFHFANYPYPNTMIPQPPYPSGLQNPTYIQQPPHSEVPLRPHLIGMDPHCIPPMSSRPTSMTFAPSTVQAPEIYGHNNTGAKTRPRSYLDQPFAQPGSNLDLVEDDSFVHSSNMGMGRKSSIGVEEFVEEEEEEGGAVGEIGSGERVNPVRFVPICCYEDAQAIRAVAFHPSGGHFAIGTNSRKLMICRYPADKLMSNQNEDHMGSPSPPTNVLLNRNKHHRGSVYCAVFSQTGELLATGSNDKTIRLMRIQLDADRCQVGAEMELEHVHDGTVRDIIFMEERLSAGSSSDILISGGAGNCRLRVTSCDTGRTIRSFEGHTAPILGLYNWGSASSFVSCSQDKTIRFWDLRASNATSIVWPDFNRPTSGVTSVCVDPGGKLLVSGHEDASVMLYDIYGGRIVQTFRPHGDEVRTVRFSNAAYYLLSGSYDKRIVITDMRGNLTESLSYLPVAEHRDKVIQCRWHPRDFVFLSTSADKTAVLWSLPSQI